MLTKELIANVRRIEIRTRHSVDALTAGAYHSVFKGRGVEFDEVREYIPGNDDIRAIDWNVTARFGHPFVKKFVEERELSVFLLVDISASGDCGSSRYSTITQSAELAALLAFSAVRNNDRVGMLQFSDRKELFVRPQKGRRHVLRLIREMLAHERVGRKTDIGLALQTVSRLARRRSVVFLISDMLDSNFEQDLAITASKHDVIGIRVRDPRERSMPSGDWLLMEDAEVGGTMVFNGRSEETVKQYLDHVETFRAEQKRLFHRCNVDMIDLFSGDDPVAPLMNFFKQRGMKR